MFSTESYPGKKRRYRRWKFLLVPLAIVAFIFIAGTVVQYLWNAILPPVAGLGTLTFWQAVGLLALCRLLFGGFRGGPRQGWRGNGAAMRSRERWMQMSEEERQQFRKEWRQRCQGRRRERPEE